MGKNKLKNILVPIDFSAVSQHAIRHAVLIAERSHGQITLMHVVEPFADSVGANATMVTTAMGLVREMQRQGSQRLQSMAIEIMKGKAVHVRAIVTIGRIAPAVKRKATETRADLIVMGTHGASGFVENLMGSNTYRVSTLSKLPVLSVHKPIGKYGYRHIVYPVRDKVRAMDKFADALAFAKLFKARVHIVCFLQPEKKTTEKTIRRLCTRIEKQFSRHGVDTKTVFVTTGKLAAEITRYAQKHQGALIVINQDYDFRLTEMFQGTFTKRILQRVLSPVLSVPR